jgi:hypothetical protein
MLTLKDLKDRTNLVNKFIGVAKHLLALTNYNSLMGILVGLNMSPVSRLKLTMAGVNPKKVEV